MSFISLAGKTLAQSQEPQASPASAPKQQPAANGESEPGLTLASAERVYLDAQLGTTIAEGFGRYSSHPSGRGIREELFTRAGGPSASEEEGGDGVGLWTCPG